MSLVVPLVVVGCVAGAMICLGLAAVAWHYREVPSALPFGILVAAVGAWSFATAAVVTSDGGTATYVADRIVRATAVQIPPLWFLFVMTYVDEEAWASWPRIAALWAYPVVYVALAVTAPLHGLAAGPADVEVVSTGGITAPHVPAGLAAVPTAAYAIVLVAAGIVALIRCLLRSRDVYRNQTAVLVAGGAVGLGTALVMKLGVLGHPGIDLTPLAVATVGAAIGWALLRYDFLQLRPLAEDALVDELPDPVFVLDSENCLIDSNPAAERLLDGPDPTGDPLQATAPGLPPNLDDAEPFRWNGTTRADGVTYFDPIITPLEDQFGTARGRLVVLRDITGQQRRQDRLEALQPATRGFLGARTDDAIAEIVVAYAERTLACQAAGVYLRADDGTVRTAATTPTVSDLFEDERGLLRAGEARGATDAMASGDPVETPLEEATGGPLAAVRYVPLGDLGALAVATTDPGGLDDGDADFATILARTTQVALHRVERESDLRRHRRALERRTEQITFFNDLLAHSLRNALLVIEGRAELLRSSLPDGEAEHVDTIVGWCSDLAALNDEISAVTDAVTAPASQRLEAVDLSRLLWDRQDVYDERYPDATVAVDVEPSHHILANELVTRVIDNLVDNAVVHNDGETPHVEIWTIQAADRVQLHVADDGPGITEAMKSTVFRREVGADETASGFGVHFVSILMDLYGGTLRYEDNDPTGTVAVLEFQQSDPDDGVAETAIDPTSAREAGGPHTGENERLETDGQGTHAGGGPGAVHPDDQSGPDGPPEA